MISRLLETRFHLPVRRVNAVSRPRLLDRLHHGLAEGHKLTLISAPAGYGKTALIAEWLRELADCPHQLVWLALEPADNDPPRFWSYLLAALRRARANLEVPAWSMLQLPHPPPPETLVAELIGELAADPAPLLLALDDYHVIQNARIHQALEYFLDHQPPQVHLALTTRVDPPFPLARLRARNQITEVRLHDLRFTNAEVGQFFRQTAPLELSAEAVTVLEERTEGWAVGLQLAALALQRVANRDDFMQTFRGTHRFVLDYLADEVLKRQEAAVCRFLIQTSILDRFCAELCDAVTGRNDSRTLLAGIEQANLFLVPLDDDRVWYRYHHLFADYLRTELAEPEAAQLRERAACWYETHDLAFDAVRYALASGNHDLASDMIERAIRRESTWSGGELATLVGWLDALPGARLRARPLLSLHASRALYLAGRIELAEYLLDQVEQALDPAVLTGELAHAAVLTAVYRGSIAAFRGEVSRAAALIDTALSRLPAAEYLARARATDARGLVYELAGEPVAATRAFLQAAELARAAGVRYLVINACCEAALMQLSQGLLSQALQTCRSVLDEPYIPPHGLALAVMGEIARERNELTAAREYLEQGIALCRQGGLTDDLRMALCFLARVQQAQGDTAAAMAAATQADILTRSYQIPRLTLFAAAHLARLHLATDQLSAALAWAAEYQANRAAAPVEYLREFEDLTLAHILLAAGDLDGLEELLDRLIDAAITSQRVRAAIEALILRARLDQARGATPAAVARIAHALQLAAPASLRRVFLEQGVAIGELLGGARAAAPGFVTTMLDELGPPPGSGNPPLAEPLSDQERRVLELIIAGKSNQEIAAALVISVGTAKWHVHNILQKLGVNNRSQAIARARELGLDNPSGARR